jgi:hypothetical protein
MPHKPRSGRGVAEAISERPFIMRHELGNPGPCCRLAMTVMDKARHRAERPHGARTLCLLQRAQSKQNVK